MISFAWLLLAALGSAIAGNREAASPVIVESVKAAGMPGFLQVRESTGCSGDEDNDDLVTEFKGGHATFRQRIWLSLRESVAAGPVMVARDGDSLRVEVDVAVDSITPGEAVAACIRPVQLVLEVPGLEQGDYEVQFARSPSKP